MSHGMVLENLDVIFLVKLSKIAKSTLKIFTLRRFFCTWRIKKNIANIAIFSLDYYGSLTTAFFQSLQLAFCFIFQEDNGATSKHQESKTLGLSSLRSAAVIGYANGVHQTTDQVERTSSNHQDKVIKSFFKEMIRKLCPERPRYVDHPTDEDNVDASEVSCTLAT